MKKLFFISLILSFLTSSSYNQTISIEENASDIASKVTTNATKNINYKNFQRIELGMNYEQVSVILNSKGKLTSNRQSGGYESKSYQWNGINSAKIKLSFVSDAVVSKSQTGLNSINGDSDLNFDKFKLIKIGMSYEAISKVLGAEGEITKLTKNGNSILASYIWKGSDYKRIQTNFKNNQLINFSQSNLKSNNISKLSYEMFTKVKLGMTYEEVVGIIGVDGDQTSSSNVNGKRSRQYRWKGDKYDNIKVTFQNGKLISKSQTDVRESKGLKGLTLDNFNKVDVGMSYEEAVKIIGFEGEMTRISKVGDTIMTVYIWNGTNYARIYTVFKTNKLLNKSQANLK